MQQVENYTMKQAYDKAKKYTLCKTAYVNQSADRQNIPFLKDISTVHAMNWLFVPACSMAAQAGSHARTADESIVIGIRFEGA